ncbi:MAG: glycogen synthase [Firmicutes bacterium]|nr:glycogen synthase [Bacillota bacterium]
MPRKKKTEEVAVEEVVEAPAKKSTAKKTTKKAVTKKEEVVEEAPKKARKTTKKVAKEDAVVEEAPKKTTRKTTKKAVKEETAEEKPAKKTTRKTTTKKAKKEEVKVEEVKEAPVVVDEIKEEATVEEPVVEAVVEEAVVEEEVPMLEGPRRSIAFIGSECYPFCKTGGLGDVMYALPKALSKLNCDVKVIMPRYECIPWKYQEKMVYRGSFQMDLCADGRQYYVGIMEYVWDGVVYDFIDNQEFFSGAKPYSSIVGDIPKFCYFSKAALAALNYMDWIPDVIHCHDWQAGLVPVYLRTLFADTPVARAKTILTIHNLRFQGVYNIPTIQYWTGLPDYVFNKDALKTGYEDANMLKGGLTYSNMISTVSNTYADEIQTEFYGENLDAHLRYHAGKLRGIVNGIDVDIWNPATDELLASQYDLSNVLTNKRENKKALQEELGLAVDDHKIVIGLISRLTDQKGLDLINAIVPEIMDEHTQIVVLGTGDPVYEESFRNYGNQYAGNFAACLMYDEALSHKIYAASDAFLIPSQFEPCGLTQLISMRYGTVPIVRETGGLKDTVDPYNMYTNEGNGFTFDRYEAGLLLDAINRAKTLYFEQRWQWDEMVQRDMDKDVSWEASAAIYRNMYLEVTGE